VILTTLYLAGAKTLTVSAPGREICSVLFLDVVPMVPSSAFVTAAGDECLSCSGFSLSETICFGSLDATLDF
jgi:hypothetical protein